MYVTSTTNGTPLRDALRDGVPTVLKRLVFRSEAQLAAMQRTAYDVIGGDFTVAQARGYYEKLLAFPVGDPQRQEALDNLWMPSDERTVLVCVDASYFDAIRVVR